MAAETKRRYATDLTDEQWALIRPLVERERHMGRPTVVDLREVVNALLYLARTGCQWRLLPTDFPNWNTVRYYFDQWTLDGTFIRIVERTLAILGRARRLSKDYEQHDIFSEAMVYLASIGSLLR